MYRNGRLVVSATDLVGFLQCEHLTALSLAAAGGVVTVPSGEDAELGVLSRRGFAHEDAHLDGLRRRGADVAEISDDDDLGTRVAQTLRALHEGREMLFQATFLDDDDPTVAWRAHADFLARVDEPSALGEFAYEPVDTKLARQVKPGAVLQLCHYAEQLERVQGRAPHRLHVVLGDGTQETLLVRDFAAYYRNARERFLDAVLAAHGLAASYPEPVGHCTVCLWAEHCADRRTADDHLSLVAGLTREQARKLETHGLPTVVDLASAPAGLRVPHIGATTLQRLRRQARLQVDARRPGAVLPYELLAPSPDRPGLAALPEPCAGDLFFDIEGDPHVGDGGLEYLLGVGWMDAGEWRFQPFWGHDARGEKAAFESFIDFVAARRRKHPELHVYHYAPYEPSALGRLACRHATREEEVDTLLREDVLVDLYRVVRQSLVIGTPSYSLKKLEPLYMAERTGEITDAGSSIVEYERWLQTGDPQILDDLQHYNDVDCQSTRGLRDWLEQRRADAIHVEGWDVPRPGSPEPAETPTLDEHAAVVAELVDQLTHDLDDGPGRDVDEQARARWLLAMLLDWHRREDKPAWWQYFTRVHDLGEDELYDDTEAVAGLEYAGIAGHVARSVVHRYRFDPEQEHGLKPGTTVVDPHAERRRREAGPTERASFTLHALDPVAGTLDLKVSAQEDAPQPRCLIPGQPVHTTVQRAALRRLAEQALADGIDAPGPTRAVRDLLLRRPPRLRGGGHAGPLRAAGEDSLDAAIRLARDLAGGCLPIQGPPGSGKTFVGARVIVDLVDRGKRVGITANSHAVISNLLDEVMKAAHQADVTVRAIQKAEDGQQCTAPDVECTTANRRVVAALEADEVDVVAGTAWLMSREDMADQLDYLVVDEAGQLSLANVAAVGGVADNLVLIGDPRQLAQPSKGSHPPGAQVSALEHLLDGAATMPRHLGLFIDRTWRLHPDICRFVSEVVYDKRLESIPECAVQRVADGPLVAGSGLRWRPVEHRGNRTSSDEEVAQVAELVSALIGRSWTDRDGVRAAMTLEDILVVAPYNAQVSLLASALPDDARVGTVDKFQGRQAAVVIVSLAASSAEDVPRGMEFLYSRNRLNVAVSRAKALAVIVASPTLLTSRCRTVEQLRLVNGLCRFAELAQQQEATP